MQVAMDPVQVIADSPLMRSIERSSLDGLRTELESIVLDEQALVLLDGTGGGALYRRNRLRPQRGRASRVGEA